MPYTSDKQRRYMNWASAHGKIKQSVVDEFNEKSKGMDLPEKARNEKIKKHLNKRGSK
jgi:hypothetical protein